MIRVWTGTHRAGALAAQASRGSTFAYEPTADPDAAVSLTMPVRVQSWDTPRGLAPIFDMNLPEGALRERLARRFAKATGTFDDIDLLAVVGRSQIGRVRYTGLDESPNEAVPFQSVDEILRARRDGGLLEHLIEQFAAYSGISGVQPKVLVRSSDDKLSNPKGRLSTSVQSATHIVKLWDPAEYPHLAANEFFCLEVARQSGLDVSMYSLSDDGGALVVERFDRRDGSYLGFEDFCVLNGMQTRDKYRGGYETRLWKRLREFMPADTYATAADKLFQLFVVNCAVRNGDAHVKNFGLLYASVDAAPELAPVYDVVTTTAYIPQDTMALTLDGSTAWPDLKRLTKMGQLRAGLSGPRIREIIATVQDAITDTRARMTRYFRKADAELGKRIAKAWDDGVRSLSA